MRILLFIAHLALLIGAVSLTPADYAFQLGATIGSVTFIGTPILWLLLWFARTRTAVLLFCGLVVGQTGLTMAVALHFRANDRVLQEIMAETLQRQKRSAAQIAEFHLERVFEMLTPGSAFHPEELPGLLERARSAKVRFREQRADWSTWMKDAEKRVAGVSARAASNFRSGIESQRDRTTRTQKVSEDYFAGIEKLVMLLIDKQGRYRSTADGLVFDRADDGDAYDQMLDSLVKMEEEIKAAVHPGQ